MKLKHSLISVAVVFLLGLLLSSCSTPPQEAQVQRARQQADASMAKKIRVAPQMLYAPMMAESRVMPVAPPVVPELDRENYAHLESNPIKVSRSEPVSTFSIDVDSGSYSNLRRMLNHGNLPPKDAVRVEELINYFSYHYPLPKDKKQPFSISTEIAHAPWNKNNHLLHIGLKGYDLPQQNLPAANLVFLLDVSGSMRNSMELLKSSLKLLSRQLTAKDRVSIVVYAGASGLVLPPTAGNEQGTISAALGQLQAGGSTNGGAGIRLAYEMAQQAFIEGGINRIILATDGDFNVGTVDFQALLDLVERKRKTGISLTTLGLGRGNYNDALMEQLADQGNGNYAYIDTLNEARKVLVDEVSSTLMTIAKDVKIQVEFNPAVVKEYRLIGYENRLLKREDFNNDKVDAGEIGAGHTVTALYEITLVGNEGRIDSLRYGKDKGAKKESKASELAFLRLRYKAPDGDQSQLLEQPLLRSEIISELAKTSDRFRFSAAVAAFADRLRGGKYSADFSYEAVLKLAQGARGEDLYGYRGEFVGLVRVAMVLDPSVSGALSGEE